MQLCMPWVIVRLVTWFLCAIDLITRSSWRLCLIQIILLKIGSISFALFIKNLTCRPLQLQVLIQRNIVLWGTICIWKVCLVSVFNSIPIHLLLYQLQYDIFPPQASVPFAVCGSSQLIEVKGRKVRGRLYPWGVVEGRHLDFDREMNT